MFKKLCLSILTIIFMCSGAVLSAEPANYSGVSITDFVIHKVIPEKTQSAIDSDVVYQVKNKPVLDIKNVEKKKIVVENKSDPKKDVGTKSVIAENKSQKKIIPKPKKFVSKPKPKQNSIFSTKTPIKNAIVQKPKTARPVKEIIINKNDNQAENLAVTVEKEKIKGFDEHNYTKNLNKYLNNDVDESQEVVVPTTLDSFDYMVKPLVSLGIVLLIMYILAWIYAKMRGINPNSQLFNKFNDMNKFTVLATSSLGQGKVIQLVEINGKQLVVGSTNNNINLLTEISPEELETLQAKAETKGRKSTNNSESLEEEAEFSDADNYSSRYSELYKEYINKDQ